MMNRQQTSSETNFFSLIMLRDRWEAITKDYKMPDNNGTIDNLKWFVNDGYKSNRFRPNFNKAVTIANEILEQAKQYETTDISSLHR